MGGDLPVVEGEELIAGERGAEADTAVVRLLADAGAELERLATGEGAEVGVDLPPIVVPVVKLVPGASGLPTGRGGAV